MTSAYFTPKTFQFLQQLKDNNNRAWFQDHKDEYENLVRTPALHFIEDIEPFIKELSPQFTAISKKSGGSLMRVYRDIRFSSDKTPFKTFVGIKFKHLVHKDAHAPGFYFRLSPEECFVGAGIWQPQGNNLLKIRQMLSDNPNAWKAITQRLTQKKPFYFAGQSLKTYPRGFDKNHPLVDDIKRKDFIVRAPLTRKQLYSKQLIEQVIEHYQMTTDFMDYLCTALEIPFD